MGNAAKKNTQYDNLKALTFARIRDSSNPKVLALYIDNAQYPESGLIAVGQEYIENFSQVKNTPHSYFRSPYKIISSCFCPTSIRGLNEVTDPTIIIATENKSLEFLHGKSLVNFKSYKPALEPEEVSRVMSAKHCSALKITCSKPEALKDLFVDFLYMIDENQYFIGYENGFVQRMSLENDIKIKIYNPILFHSEVEEGLESSGKKPSEEDPENDKENKDQSNINKKVEAEQHEKELEKPHPIEIIYENLDLPGIDALTYSHMNELLFVNHKRIGRNSFQRPFDLRETPIHVYKLSGEKYRKLVGCNGNAHHSVLLENRGFYIVLTSDNKIIIWNYLTGPMVLRVDLNSVGLISGSETYFTTLASHEFEMNQRYLTSDNLFSYGIGSTSSVEFPTFDGDILFAAERNGGFFISKISYENNKKEIAWKPLKVLEMRDEGDKNSRVMKSIKTSANNVNVLVYDKLQDTLYMVDHTATVRIFDCMVKSLFAPGPAARKY